MRCPKCKTESAATQEFCGMCGAKLVSPAVATMRFGKIGAGLLGLAGGIIVLMIVLEFG